MASTTGGKAESIKNDASVEHIDIIKPDPAQLDKFGSAAKTAPAEIALVRKLDTYMMV